ncbi:tripartite tricarboxylate transporter TctB family protein [Bosea sp. (in: a-proteobacteria)]|uniref:tripartite tricarboxylate transporter TctB family protein n=1 Tax=Bosea sp. (in: a-proteobacteria) TaxID=1871050 RepID=UPI00262475BA|nr:tripartite tricarboxylate transporter TctB family protein [Bosea sp. (in: a-proteobacteria)]MCO5091841.1 tripartite tricarboxylate transporter TctB family protein [Bosea sp. (in: a-proteobacteria)]
MPEIRSLDNLLTGLLLVLVAIVALGLSWNLSTGTAADMGPGFIPRLLCLLQLILGATLIWKSFGEVGERIELRSLRPLLCVAGGVLFFILTLERLGLVIAILGLVGIVTLAERSARLSSALVFAAVLAAFCYGVFVFALQLPIPVLPRGF